MTGKKTWKKNTVCLKGGRGGEECQPISPHYRSVGRRQGSCAVLGGCLSLSADLAKSYAFLKVYS